MRNFLRQVISRFRSTPQANHEIPDSESSNQVSPFITELEFIISALAAALMKKLEASEPSNCYLQCLQSKWGRPRGIILPAFISLPSIHTQNQSARKEFV